MKMKNANTVLWVMIILHLLILTGCKTENSDFSVNHFSKINLIKKNNPSLSFFNEFELPISIPSGKFNKVIGWLKEDEIIYITDSQNGSKLYTFNFETGISKLLYDSSFPIVTAIISPDRKNILVHSSPSTYEGVMTIINDQGVKLFSENFPSVEMVFEWNSFDNNQILITTFKEDWSFSNFLFNLNQREIHPYEISKPFAKWTGENKLAYLDWNEMDLSLFAPLIEKELNKVEIMLKDKLIQFDTFHEKIVTVTVNQAENVAIYTFYSNNLKELLTFKVPVLSSYSSWLIPYYELIFNKDSFLTFVPYESTEADTYHKGFELVSINLKTDKMEVILNDMDNVPITCSPNGENCLIGNQLDNLLQLKKKKIIPLFKS